MKLSAHFILERDTKGAVVFKEVASKEATDPLDMAAAKIGTLYLRKSALDGKMPKRLAVNIDTFDA